MKNTRRFGLFLASAVAVGALAAGDPAEEKKADAPKKSEKASTSRSKVIRSTPEEVDPVSPYHAATRDAGAQAGDTVVITNDYLEKMMAGLTEEQRLSGVYQAQRHIGATESTPPAPGGGATAAGDPQGAPGPDGGSEQQAARPRSVDQINAQIESLEKRLLALKNPLLPRRYSEKSDDQDPEWDEKTNLQRVEQTEKELAAARAELEEARRRSGSR